MTEEKKELVGKEVPAFLVQGDNQKGRGMEETSSEDLILPRIKLLQGLSPEVLEEPPLGKIGEFLHSLSKKCYGKELIFIPVYFFHSRIKWRDKAEGGGILCLSKDGKYPTISESLAPASCLSCKDKDWNGHAEGEDKVPACTLYYNFIVLVPDGDVVGLSLAKTQISAARRLITMIKYIGGSSDSFARKYKMTSKRVEKAGVSYYVPDFIDAGWVNELEYRKALALYTEVRSKDVSVEAEQDHFSEEETLAKQTKV
jgi:hypothetical protein